MRYIAILVCAFLVVGCAGIGGFGPSGALPGTILTDATFASANNTGTSYTFHKGKDFDIVGPVSVQVESSSILGVVATGDNGYGALYKKALAEGADDVICVKMDTHYSNILGIISTVTTKMTGVAVKWK